MHKFCTINKQSAILFVSVAVFLLSPASYALGLLELKINAPLASQVTKYLPTSIVYPQVLANESLREIADKIRPAHITTEQMMLALQRENPAAFYRNNVSFLNAGAELRIKNISTLENISVEDARIEIEKQYQTWLAEWRQREAAKRAILKSKQAIVIAQASTRVLTPTVITPPIKTTVNNTPPNTNENIAIVQGAGLESEEKETLLGRLETLESKMVNVQHLIHLREKVIEQISREHSQFSEAQQARDMLEISTKADTLSKLEKEKQENIILLKRLSVLESDIAVIHGLIKLRDSVLQNQEINVKQVMPAVIPLITKQIIMEKHDDKILIRLDEPVTVSSFSKNNQFLFSFLIALLFISVFWFIAHKRNNRIQQSLSAKKSEVMATPEKNEDTLPVEVIKYDRSNTKIEQAENTGKTTQLEKLISNDIALDPLTEADVYLTYEKYNEAEILLHKAIIREPYRQELKLKLLEVFALSRNTTKFDKQASVLFAAISKQDEDYLWQHALLMAKDLETKNPLFLVEDQKADSSKSPQETSDDSRRPVQDITDIDLEEAMGLFSSEAVDEWDDATAGEDVNDIVTEAIEHASKHSIQSIQSSKQIALNSTYFADDGADNKLDLAKAYIEMGDHIGALDLLGDVLKEGTLKQKSEAKEILAID